MAQLSTLQGYDRNLRRDLQELAANMWLGIPINLGKAGNLRAIYLIIDLTGVAAGTTFGVKHSLGDVPLGYIPIGTPKSEVVPLAPGVDASGNRIAWTSRRLYLKAPNDTNKLISLLVWATDSSQG